MKLELGQQQHAVHVKQAHMALVQEKSHNQLASFVLWENTIPMQEEPMKHPVCYVPRGNTKLDQEFQHHAHHCVEQVNTTAL